MRSTKSGMKKFVLLTAMLWAAFTFNMTAQAEETVITGKTGAKDGITWSYDISTKVLVITGEDMLENQEFVIGQVGSFNIGGYDYNPKDAETLILRDFRPSGSLCRLCYSCDALTTFICEDIDISNVTDMSEMFYGCGGLQNLDLTALDTSSVINMSYMFFGCGSLREVDVSRFCTSNVTDMCGMFGNCTSLTNLDVSNFDTSNVTDFRGMFNGMDSLESMDIGMWDTSSAVYINNMFFGCDKLKTVNVNGLCGTNVQDIRYFFGYCPSLECVELSSWDTSGVTAMEYMFWKCNSLKTVDISSFDLSKITADKVYKFFNECSSLSTIYTPKAMVEDISIELPTTFYDTDGNTTTVLTAEFCNDILVTELAAPTEYKVEHYKMNLDGETYDLAETVTVPFDGKSGDIVYGELKEYEGFTAPEQQILTITAGGENTIQYYYTRNKYTFMSGGESWIDTTGTSPDGEYYYGETITLNAIICGEPTDAFILNGWICDGVNYETSDSFTMPARDYLVAQPDCAIKTYTIHYDANGGTGTIPDSEEISYFDKYQLADGSAFSWENHEFRGWSTIPVEPGNYPSFDYFANERVSKLTTDDSITLYAVWHDFQPTTFTVNHYVESVDSEWVLEKTEVVEGLATEVYTVDNLIDSSYIEEKYTEFRGMALNGYETNMFAPEADGSTVVELYYNRITYHVDVTFYAWDAEGVVCNQVEIDGDFFAGQEVETEHWFTDGRAYTLDSWECTAESEIEFWKKDNVLYYTMPAEDIVLDIYYWQEQDSENPGAEFSIELVAASKEMIVGTTMQLDLFVDGVLQDVSTWDEYAWNIDNETVLMNESGVLTGNRVGVTTITCTYLENPSITASIEISIKIPFRDIKLSDWQYSYVVYAYQNGLMAGKTEDTFDMNGEITRAEFVTVLYNYNGKPPVTYSPEFDDVTEEDWFAKSVIWAKQNNVTAGYANGNFGVADSITREQLVVMLYKYAKATGVVTKDVTVDLSDFADAADVSSWAQKALTWATQNNIIAGKNADGVKNIAPQDSTTRGECATIMKKYITLIEK